MMIASSNSVHSLVRMDAGTPLPVGSHDGSTQIRQRRVPTEEEWDWYVIKA